MTLIEYINKHELESILIICNDVSTLIICNDVMTILQEVIVSGIEIEGIEIPENIHLFSWIPQNDLLARNGLKTINHIIVIYLE